MALHIAYRRTPFAFPIGRSIENIQIRIRHKLVVGGWSVYICPIKFSIGSHGILFLGTGKILVDEISIGINLTHGIVETLHAVDTRLIVEIGLFIGHAAPCVGRRIINGTITIAVAKTFDKVEAESIDLVGRKPVLQCIFPLHLNKRIFLFPIIENAIGMWSRGIVERILCRRVELIPWMEAVALIEHDIENHSNSTCMTFVDETAIVVGSAISLIGSEIEVRVVAP